MKAICNMQSTVLAKFRLPFHTTWIEYFIVHLYQQSEIDSEVRSLTYVGYTTKETHLYSVIVCNFQIKNNAQQYIFYLDLCKKCQPGKLRVWIFIRWRDEIEQCCGRK